MTTITWDFSDAPLVNKAPTIIKWNAEAFTNPVNKPAFDGWDGVISSDFGDRVLNGVKEFHGGIDIALPQGTPLEINISGEVIASGSAVSQGYSANYGNLVVVKDKIGQEHIYAHLESTSVEVGDKVSVGELIGNIGSTGRSTGSHLHYEIKWNGYSIDPTKYVKDAQEGNSFLYSHPRNYNTREELEAIAQENVSNEASRGGILDFIDFVNEVRANGLSMALYNKPFDQLIIDTLTTTMKAIAIFITGNSDLFFLMPAIAFLFLTFMMGSNRFTKWIIPLLMAYVCSLTAYYWLT